jgi:hypothetical protein
LVVPALAGDGLDDNGLAAAVLDKTAVEFPLVVVPEADSDWTGLEARCEVTVAPGVAVTTAVVRAVDGTGVPGRVEVVAVRGAVVRGVVVMGAVVMGRGGVVGAVVGVTVAASWQIEA